MRIVIADDNDNYLRWGNLVVTWVNDETKWPINVGDLRRQMANAGVNGSIAGPDNRGVSIQRYPDDAADQLPPVELVLPTQAMLNARLALVRPGPYPRDLMPSFMDIAYGGAARANLSQQEADDFAIRRVGEYSINECC